MTKVKWQTSHTSERGLQLRKMIDALGVSRRYKPQISPMGRIACEACPFRDSCDLDTKNGRPYGHLAVILTKGTPRFPDSAKNRRHFRDNLDDPVIDTDRTPCADLLLSSAALKKQQNQQQALDPNMGSKTKTYSVVLDFPITETFDHPPTQDEVDRATDRYYNSLQ